MGDFQLLGFTLARRINNCDNFRFSKILNGKKITTQNASLEPVGRPPSRIFKIEILTALHFSDTFCCIIVPNFSDIGHTTTEMSRYFAYPLYFYSEISKFTGWSNFMWHDFVELRNN